MDQPRVVALWLITGVQLAGSVISPVVMVKQWGPPIAGIVVSIGAGWQLGCPRTTAAIKRGAAVTIKAKGRRAAVTIRSRGRVPNVCLLAECLGLNPPEGYVCRCGIAGLCGDSVSFDGCRHIVRQLQSTRLVEV